jgi:hypothetical protein
VSIAAAPSESFEDSSGLRRSPIDPTATLHSCIAGESARACAEKTSAIAHNTVSMKRFSSTFMVSS